MGITWWRTSWKPRQIKAIVSVLEKFSGKWDCDLKEAPLASKEQILYCHTESHFENSKTVTPICLGWWSCLYWCWYPRVSKAFNAVSSRAGAACMAVDDVYHGRVKNAFCCSTTQDIMEKCYDGVLFVWKCGDCGFSCLDQRWNGPCGHRWFWCSSWKMELGILLKIILDILLFNASGWFVALSRTVHGCCVYWNQKHSVPIHSDPQPYRDIFEQKFCLKLTALSLTSLLFRRVWCARDDPPADQLF